MIKWLCTIISNSLLEDNSLCLIIDITKCHFDIISLKQKEEGSSLKAKKNVYRFFWFVFLREKQTDRDGERGSLRKCVCI